MKSELQRFWRLALGLGIAFFLFLKAASAFVDIFSPSVVNIALTKMIFFAGGLILGLYQMGTYRKVNRWAYLIHRPMAPGKIFLALAVAAALLLALSLALPLLLITFLTDFFSSQWVDTRHYLTPIYLFGFAFCFYLIGCFIRLSPSKAPFLLILLPAMLLQGRAQGLWVFLPMVLVLVWLGYLAYSSFKPDLSKHLERPVPVAASAFAVQCVAFILLVAGSTVIYQTGVVFAEEGWKGYAVHAWNEHFADGTFLDTQYMDGKDALAHGLEAKDSERARHLRREIELAEVDLVRPGVSSFPERHQLMQGDRNLPFEDEEQEILWTFSHDRMLFFGRDTKSGLPAGWLGVSGPVETAADASQRFSEIPQVFGGRYFITRRLLYEWSPDLQRVSLRFELPEGEKFAALYGEDGGLGAVLTDRAYYLFEPRDSEREAGLLTEVSKVPLPADLENLESIQTADLIDGTLLSFLFGTHSERGFHEARQVLIEVGADGAVDPVADVPLGQGWPVWYRHRGFIASPVLQTAQDLVLGVTGSSGRLSVTLKDVIQLALPLQVKALALFVAMISALLTFWVSRGRDLSVGRRRVWIVAAFLLGLPVFLSLLLLTGRSERMTAPERSAGLPLLRRKMA